MAIFDEPSRGDLPQPTFEDVAHAGGKGLLSIIPFVGGVGSELVGLLSSPVAQRRDAWLEDLERRLRELENGVEGFRFDNLGTNEQFVSAVLQATQSALRSHQAEKLDALRNAVLNVAIGTEPFEDLQLIFLNFVDTFTPTHLRVLRFFQDRGGDLEALRRQRDVSDQAVRDLRDRGLVNDTRPYVARNRDTNDALVMEPWELSNFGRQFLAFITSPERKKARPR